MASLPPSTSSSLDTLPDELLDKICGYCRTSVPTLPSYHSNRRYNSGDEYGYGYGYGYEEAEKRRETWFWEPSSRYLLEMRFVSFVLFPLSPFLPPNE